MPPSGDARRLDRRRTVARHRRHVCSALRAIPAEGMRLPIERVTCNMLTMLLKSRRFARVRAARHDLKVAAHNRRDRVLYDFAGGLLDKADLYAK